MVSLFELLKQTKKLCSVPINGTIEEMLMFGSFFYNAELKYSKPSHIIVHHPHNWIPSSKKSIWLKIEWIRKNFHGILEALSKYVAENNVATNIKWYFIKQALRFPFNLLWIYSVLFICFFLWRCFLMLSSYKVMIYDILTMISWLFERHCCCCMRKIIAAIQFRASFSLDKCN